MNKAVIEKLNELLERMERARISDYVTYLYSTKRILWTNFLAGLSRGFGVAIGFTILGAIVVVFLSRLTVDNLPLIGEFLADVIEIVQNNLR